MKQKIVKVYRSNKKNNQLKRISDSFDNTKKTKVLILCFAYNHEKYISRCLDGMLDQRVNFNVKILVHDDNSSDETKDIVDKYQKKYPSMISVIHQGHNLYSKENAMLPIFAFLKDYLEGDYIAMCEGDDYWTDDVKIQTQVDLMESMPQCRFCAHKVNVIDAKTSELIRTIPNKKFKVNSGIISESKFMTLASKKYPFQTSSYLFRTKDFIDYLNNIPEFAKIMPTEDESILLYFGQLGKTCYINHALSNYVKFSDGSWSNSQSVSTLNENIDRLKKMISSIELFNSYTNGHFFKQCSQRIIKHKIRILFLEKKIDLIFKNKDYRTYFKKNYPKDYYLLLIRRFFHHEKD